MVRALVPLVAGIAAACRFAVPSWGAAVGFGLCILAARMMRRRIAADICICLALFMAGWCAAELRYDASEIPAEERAAEIVVDEVVARREGVLLAEGRMTACETDGGVSVRRHAIRISADPSLDLTAGDRIVALCRVKPYSRRSERSYERYMARRGFAGQVTLDPRNVMKHVSDEASFGSRLRARAVERIGRLGLSPEVEALTRAVAVGDRSGITPEMRRRYSLAGTAHLLAVSGLHVGFVFAIVNLLLWWMPLLRRGHLWRCAAAVAAIWLYASVTGFSPSVTRAAIMFTALQLSMGLNVRFDTLNALALTACVMLLFDARYLFDAGFLMSFTAVAAIVEWGVPLARAGRNRRGDKMTAGIEKRNVAARRRMVGMAAYVGRRLWGAVAVSLAASVATMPLAALFFGSASLWSIVTGPASILPSAVLLGAGLLWSLVPLPLLAPVASRAVNLSGGALDALTRWCAEIDVLSFGFEPDGAVCAAIYIGFIAFALWLRRRRNDRI